MSDMFEAFEEGRLSPSDFGPPPHECDTGWFDRVICPEPCGTMHSYCNTCGKRQDACAHEDEQR